MTPNFTKSRVRFSTLTRYYNITKAKQRLGYAPIVSLEEGIKRGVQDVLAREKAQ
jgi:sterol-4alpha-carboxylate 3-dehydrogenase (decarboxylating)